MSTVPRSANLLVDRLLTTPGLINEVTANPAATLRNVADQVTRELPPPAFITDRWTYRLVVLSLGIVCVSAMIGAIVLSAMAAPGSVANIPDVLTALGAAAIGALAGLLAPSPSRQ